eukprot:2804821-Amphidinium_carterae.1
MAPSRGDSLAAKILVQLLRQDLVDPKKAKTCQRKMCQVVMLSWVGCCRGWSRGLGEDLRCCADALVHLMRERSALPSHSATQIRDHRVEPPKSRSESTTEELSTSLRGSNLLLRCTSNSCGVNSGALRPVANDSGMALWARVLLKRYTRTPTPKFHTTRNEKYNVQQMLVLK